MADSITQVILTEHGTRVSVQSVLRTGREAVRDTTGLQMGKTLL